MIKTILTLAAAVVASAFLTATDAKAQSVDMHEPIAVCSDAGNCSTINPPSTWAWDRKGLTYFRVDGVQEAVACATPQILLMWNGQYWDRTFVAKGTVGRVINDRVCDTAAQLGRTSNRPAMY